MKPYSLKWFKSKCFLASVLFPVAILIAGSLAPAADATIMTVISVREKAEIEDGDILLGSIAAIEGDNTHLVDRLKRIVIGKAPMPGKSRQYEQRDLMMRLKRHDVDWSGVRLEIPQRIEISRSFVEIQKPELQKIITDFILDNMHQENGSLRIKEIRVPESVILPKGRVAYKVLSPRNRRLMGRCPLTVELSVNGHVQKKIWATAMIEVMGTVVVTRKPLGRYKPITEDDIVMQTMDLANLPHNVVTDPHAVLGKRTKRAIGARVPIKTDTIELPPLVKRGDIVVIIAESRGLKITARGQVKKKGRLGERIPVVNVDSKKLLYALVVDSNTVKVEF